MLFDLEARFYKKQTDKKPRYSVPMGVFSPLELDWFEKNGFQEDPESTPGYLDYIKRDAKEKDLEELTKDLFICEMLDVLDEGEDTERIDIVAMELQPIDDKGTIPPKVLVKNDISVLFGWTDNNGPVMFFDGNHIENRWKTKRMRAIQLGDLKRYFGVITQNEVMMKMKRMRNDHWLDFDKLVEWLDGIQQEEIILNK